MAEAIPSFRTLDDGECRTLLARHHVGRLAFTFKDRVDIEPITYVLDGEWLYARTSPGTKLTKLEHNPWVAFEVDNTTGAFDWQSVVVHGTAYFMLPEGQDRKAHDAAVAVLRSIDPRALTHEDLVPTRTAIFRIHIDSMTGRAASTKAANKG